jgi:hypothetical protein
MARRESSEVPIREPSNKVDVLTTKSPGESPTGGELDSDDLDMQINKRQSRTMVDGYVLVGGPDKRTEYRALDVHEGLWMCWK